VLTIFIVACDEDVILSGTLEAATTKVDGSREGTRHEEMILGIRGDAALAVWRDPPDEVVFAATEALGPARDDVRGARGATLTATAVVGVTGLALAVGRTFFWNGHAALVEEENVRGGCFPVCYLFCTICVVTVRCVIAGRSEDAGTCQKGDGEDEGDTMLGLSMDSCEHGFVSSLRG